MVALVTPIKKRLPWEPFLSLSMRAYSTTITLQVLVLPTISILSP